MEKSSLRQHMLELRKGLTAADFATKSAAILERLHDIPAYAYARTVLCYVASKDNEVDTFPLIEELLAQDRTILVPVSGKDRSLSWSRIERLHELAPGRFGILEPLPEFLRITTPPGESIAIVPGIAFQPDGIRLGYGGGYYDRFLAPYPGISIGLAFDLQIVEFLPAEAHDIPLDFVVTESQTYNAAPRRFG